MTKRILITGSNGFIGRNLKSELQKKGYQVEDFNTEQGDIADTKLEYKNISHVFHLAGKSFVPDSWKYPEEFKRVNVEGTRNVLEFCKENRVSLTFISSYVYGTPKMLPINEMHPINAFNPYAESKILAEELCNFYIKEFQLPVAIIRPFNIYGKNQPEHFLIPEIIKQATDDSYSQITLMDLAPKRDYLYMDDFIKALILLYEKDKQGIFNIGSGYSMSVQEIVDTIMAVSGRKKDVLSKSEVRKNEVSDVVADITKITSETGWIPETTFSDGIRQILNS